MKILSFQQFPLSSSSGGSRILRRIYEGHEHQIHSLAVTSYPAVLPINNISETLIQAIPIQRSWMRWRLRNISIWLREKVFITITIQKIRKAALTVQYDVIHVLNHGPVSNVLNHDNFLENKLLWVSFHDHYSTMNSSFVDACALWKRADRRLVISNELGKEYQRIFGEKDFEIITDGVSEEELSEPLKNTFKELYIIYFGGLLQLDYLPLFQVLADSLDQLSSEGYAFKLVLRGTQKVKFLTNRAFEIEYRPASTDFSELKQELDSATILYLPLISADPNFYLFSLSTKMVGYFGAPGTILYHGPDDSAACKLLRRSESAVICTSQSVLYLTGSLKKTMEDGQYFSKNAKLLAKKQFNLKLIQKQFWQKR